MRKAMTEGELEHEDVVMAGQVALLVKKVRPVAEIIDSTIGSAERYLKKYINSSISKNRKTTAAV